MFRKTNTEKLVTLLRKLQPGFQEYEVFEQMARIMVLPGVEFVPLRINQHGRAEVLLLKREPSDRIWPGKVHTPGTIIRATDIEAGLESVFHRIKTDELGDTKISEPHFVCNILHQSRRGGEQAQVYWVEVLEDSKVGTFYETDNLPPELIDSQTEFIKLAVDSFIKAKL